MSIDLFSHQGNDATIIRSFVTPTRTGASLYHVILKFNDNSTVEAVAFIDPMKSSKMAQLAKVYDKFKPNDKVHANLYKSGNFVDIYRLELLNKPAKQELKTISADMVPGADIDVTSPVTGLNDQLAVDPAKSIKSHDLLNEINQDAQEVSDTDLSDAFDETPLSSLALDML